MPDNGESEWTVSTLKQYMESKLEAQDKAVQIALTAAEKATAKSEAGNDKRFESVNEFRGQLKDQAATLLPRAEADAKFGAQEEKINRLAEENRASQSRLDITLGQSNSQKQTTGQRFLYVALGISALATVVSVLAFFLK